MYITETKSIEIAGKVLSGKGYTDDEIESYARDARNYAQHEANSKGEAIRLAFDYCESFS